MKLRSSTVALTAFSAYLSMAAGPCTPTAVFSCPSGTSDDGTGTGNCVSNSSAAAPPLAPAPPLGTPTSGFYYMGFDAGYTLGNGTQLTTLATVNQAVVPDSAATFAAGPLPGANLAPVTESFTSVAVYNSYQAQLAGIETYDAVTGEYYYPDGYSGGLTGYSVAVGYALTTSGNVVGLIARYTPRGVLDTSFNGTGYILGSPGGFAGGSFSMLKAVAIDYGGNIVVGGYTNTLPTISATSSGFGFLNLLNSTDWNPFAVSGQNTGNGGSVIAYLARYTPLGVPDPKFNTANVPGLTCPTTPDGTATACAASGWAVNGYATSPLGGFLKTTASGGSYFGYWDELQPTVPHYTFDTINGLAIDRGNGIFVVGSSGYLNSDVTLASEAFIAHYSSGGRLDGVLNGPNFPGTFAGGDAIESFNTVTVDRNGFAIAAGVSGPAGAGNNTLWNSASSFQPLIARFQIPDPGSFDEIMIRDTTFNNGNGYLLASSVGGSDYIESSAYDGNSTTGTIVLAGQAGYGSGNSCELVMTVTDDVNATIQNNLSGGPCPNNDLAGGKNESLHGIAVIQSATQTAAAIKWVGGTATTRYIATGYSTNAVNRTRSLIISYTPALALDTTFVAGPTGPYNDSTGLGLQYTNTLPPFYDNQCLGWLHLAPCYAQSTATLPIFDGPPLGGYQLGPAAAGYGGGITEQFNAIAPSADGQSAMVVGFTTDYNGVDPAVSNAQSMSGRTFPIFLEYGRSITTTTTVVGPITTTTEALNGNFGVFTNFGDAYMNATDFYYLQGGCFDEVACGHN